MAIAAPNKANKMDASYYKPEQVIDTDVVIIGGGGMGAYSAIQLKDAGKRLWSLRTNPVWEVTQRLTWITRLEFPLIWV